jgi:hypothetical protein
MHKHHLQVGGKGILKCSNGASISNFDLLDIMADCFLFSSIFLASGVLVVEKYCHEPWYISLLVITLI